MFDDADDKPLLLPSLSIQGFRGIDELQIDRLGRVTLLAGRNGIGKTTVLDAVRLFSERGHLSSLVSVLTRNEEVAERIGPDDKRLDVVSCEALFHGRTPEFGASLSVGSSSEVQHQLSIELMDIEDIPWESAQRLRRYATTGDPALKVIHGDFEDYVPALIDRERQGPALSARWTSRRGLGDGKWPEPLNYCSLGPGLLDNWELDRLWGEIALTPSESLALRALHLVPDLGIEGIAVVPGANRYSDRRVVIRMNSGQRVPLRSLGDGATRLFSVAIALGNSAGGFLLIDEAENGLHHSLQVEFWSLVIRTARELNVQVIATTHSWDCITGFAMAAQECQASEGSLMRLQRDNNGLSVVEYSGDDLEVAAKQHIEVR